LHDPRFDAEQLCHRLDRVPGDSDARKGDAASATVAERVASRLARYLGPHTARIAVKTFAARGLGRAPEALTKDDVPALAHALRPMLRTLVGRARSEIVVQQILGDFGL
jgi:hypothetical protein